MNVEQKIEQPMVTPAGQADSHAVLLPVSEISTALLISPVALTSVTVTEDTTISTADLDKHIRATMGTCGQLVAERDRVTAEIRRQAKDVLHPALIEMRKRYNSHDHQIQWPAILVAKFSSKSVESAVLTLDHGFL